MTSLTQLGTQTPLPPSPDQAVLERSGSYRGYYFVLGGRVSPIDGRGPKDIGAEALLTRASDGAVREVILATSFTAEGEATSYVLGDMVIDQVKATAGDVVLAAKGSILRKNTDVTRFACSGVARPRTVRSLSPASWISMPRRSPSAVGTVSEGTRLFWM